MTPTDLQEATTALDGCDASLVDLEARCCEPGRSPQMAELGGTLAAVRAALRRFTTDDDSSKSRVLASLAEARTRVRRLQVGCCDPRRLPMYTEIIEGLDTVWLAVDRAASLRD